MTTGRDHWPLHARQWALVGPPLRPCAEDVSLVAAEVSGWSVATGRAPRALLLGVTPELATMTWPAGTALVAVDRAASMIDAIFPALDPRLPAGATAVVGDWLALPHGRQSIDIALGDGCLSNLAFPGAYRTFAAELRRVLAEDGRLIVRLFAAPDHRESLDDIAIALRTGRIGSFHALKWRIAMAIQPDDRNVAVVEIWRAFDELVEDRSRLGWDPAVIATIDVYRESDLVYSFPTLDEVRGVFDGFAEVGVLVPTYELGDRCPTLVLVPK